MTKRFAGIYVAQVNFDCRERNGGNRIADGNRSVSVRGRVDNDTGIAIDIGIAAAYLTAEATAQGLDTSILGWLDDQKLRAITGIDAPARLVVLVGYAKEGDTLRKKTRKSIEELVTVK